MSVYNASVLCAVIYAFFFFPEYKSVGDDVEILYNNSQSVSG